VGDSRRQQRLAECDDTHPLRQLSSLAFLEQKAARHGLQAS
jgi:hypothetical protein